MKNTHIRRLNSPLTFYKASSSRLCAALLPLLMTMPANAQNVLEDVVVTATKSVKNAQDIGASFSVVDGEGLDRLDSAEELTQKLAGVQAAVANGNQIAFQIRGIGAVDHQALTPTAAAIYVDGVYQATNVQTGPLLFDIERAEVLKGPQGTLYGRNATAGAINFISKQPGKDKTGYIQSEFGNFDRVNLNAAANLPVSDELAVRVSGRYLSQGPLIDNVVTDPAVLAPSEAGGERDEFGLRAIAAWTPSDQTEVSFKLHYAEDNGINPSSRNEGLDLDDHEISVGPTGVQDTDNEFYGASVQIIRDFDGFELTSLTAYEGYNQQYGFDFAALPSFFGGQNANLSYDRDFSQYSQELRLSRQGEWYDSIVGLYLEAEDFDQDYRVWCGQLDLDTLIGSCNYIAANSRVGTAGQRVDNNDQRINASTLQSLISQERETAALFTYNQYSLQSELELVLGARLTYERISAEGEGRHIFEDGVMGINNQNDLGPAIGANKIEESHLSGNIGLNYKLSDEALLYASYATGYKSGGFNGEVISNAAHFDDAGLFGPETVKTAEIGAKLSGPNFSFNIAAYHNDYSDPQARFFDEVTLENGTSVSLNSLSNFEGATSRGVDIDAQYLAAEGVTLYGALTLQDTEIEDSELTYNGIAYLDGDALPFASDTSLVVGLNYSRPVTNGVHLDVDISGKYQSDFVTGLDGVERGNITTALVQDAYEIIDMSGFLSFEQGYSVGLWSRNISGSDYATSGYRFFGDTTFRGAPSTYGVSIGYRY